MRLPVFAFLAFIFAIPVRAEEPLYTLSTEDGTIEVLSHGFWRWSDEDGQRCTSIGGPASVCALPSEWSPTKMYGNDLHLKFLGKNDISGSFVVFFPNYVQMTLDDMIRFEADDLGKDGGTLLGEFEELEIRGERAFRLAIFHEHPKRVEIKTGFFAAGIPVYATTVHPRVSLQHEIHNELHANLIAALQIKGAP